MNESVEQKIAEAQRAEAEYEEALLDSKRKRHEADVFARWTREQIAAGANPKDLTWGACVEALGLLQPAKESTI